MEEWNKQSKSWWNLYIKNNSAYSVCRFTMIEAYGKGQ